MEQMLERFLNYISFDTKSDPSQVSCPSTAGQLVLGEQLVKELKEMNLQNIRHDENGYIYATLPGNVPNARPIGFVAHMDTSPDLDGKCENPQIIENYDGQDIRLNDQFTTTVKDFPFLSDLKGHTLVTTDGTTLLGADDKSGITIIMTAIQYLIDHPEIKHGDIQIGFTPDEEIGRGADLFDVENFGAEFAYTVDGGPIGELEYENFNAASVRLNIQGKNVHPGTAKGVMINALRIANELDQMLPVEQKPEYTEGYEGFFLLTDLSGAVDHAEANYIIRDHSRERFEEKKQLMQQAVNFLNIKYHDAINLTITDSYYNMREKIEPHMEIIELAKEAMSAVGVTPEIKAIRGGTDGARLSYMGLPCPNLFTGGYNFHGRFELLSVDTMKKAVETVVKIAEINAK
ncbi:peptidase T [Atopobacter phocae]|uniref:peptidase T n=1 Tax=Atopobacter phocae TaxID=136492 RepID=UPI000470684D|nr:peptidase T [Atopobacter phocae]